MKLKLLTILLTLCSLGYSQVIDISGGNIANVQDGYMWVSGSSGTGPVLSGLTIGTHFNVDSVMTPSYTYTDAEGDLPGTHTYQWYRSTNSSGANETAINGATSSTYTLANADTGKWIGVKITPKDIVGSVGTVTASTRDSVWNWNAYAEAYLVNLSSDVPYADWVKTNTFVKGLVANSLWNSLHAIYPLLGISAADHKWNLKDPRDLDAAFRLTFDETAGYETSHAGGGLLGRASKTFYANTFLSPATTITGHQGSLTFYTESGTSDANEWAMGSYSSPGTYNSLIISRTDGSNYSYVMNAAIVTSAVKKGVFTASRTDNTHNNLYRNDTSVASSATDQNLFAMSTQPIYLMANNQNGTKSGYTYKKCLYASIGNGLSQANITAYVPLIKALKHETTYPLWDDGIIQYKNPVMPLGTQIYLMDINKDMKFGQTTDSLVFDVDYNDTYSHKIAFTDTVVFANIFPDGGILFGTTKDSLYYSGDSLKTIVHKDLLNTDGSVLAKTGDGSYYRYLGSPQRFMNGTEQIAVFGNYTGWGAGGGGLNTAPARIYYTHLNTLKIAYNDSTGITHNHGVALNSTDNSLLMFTGDIADGTQIRKLAYTPETDTWTSTKLIAADSKSGFVYKVGGMVIQNDSAMWVTDNTVTADTSHQGIFKSKISELSDTTQRERVYKMPTASVRLGLARYGTHKLIMGGLNSTACLYVSADNGKTWTADKLFGVTSGSEFLNGFVGPDDRGFYIARPNYYTDKKIRLLIKPK